MDKFPRSAITKVVRRICFENQKIITTAALCLLSCILCACQQTDSTKSDTAKGVETDTALPELHIGADILKPFFYIDENGDYAGIDAGMAVRAGSKLEYLLLHASADHPSISVYSCGTFAMAETAFVKGYIGALGGHR